MKLLHLALILALGGASLGTFATSGTLHGDSCVAGGPLDNGDDTYR